MRIGLGKRINEKRHTRSSDSEKDGSPTIPCHFQNID
jgi:hypothetical protein